MEGSRAQTIYIKGHHHQVGRYFAGQQIVVGQKIY